MKTYWGSGCIAPHILDLGIRWRWVVSFTPPAGLPPEKEPIGRRLGGRRPPAVVSIVKSRRLRWTGHIDRIWETRNQCRIFVGKAVEKLSLWRWKMSWEVDRNGFRSCGVTGFILNDVTRLNSSAREFRWYSVVISSETIPYSWSTAPRIVWARH
jgi:hypothetical protein